MMSAASLAPTVSWAADGDEARGIRVGSFLVRPSFAVGETYDSNIFLEDSGENDSFLTTFTPDLLIESNWNRHALRLELGSELGFFTHDSDDDYFDHNAALSGVLDVTRKMRIRGRFGYLHDHEARGTVDVPTSLAEPVEFDEFNGSIVGEMEFGRFRFEAFGNAADLDFEDTERILGGKSNEDDRDRVAAEGGVELGYGVREGYEVFVRGSYLVTDYDDALDDSGLDRDSTGFRVLGGLKVDLTRLVEASVGAGYLERDYDDPSLSNSNGFAVDAGVKWSVTPITTVFLSANREINETTLSGASGADTLAGEIAVKHELRRNLTLRASSGYAEFDYDGISRVDDIYSAGFGAEWRITRRLTLEPSYDFQLRDSNEGNLDYTDHRATLSVKYGF